MSNSSLLAGLSSRLGQDPNHMSPPAGPGLVHPDRILEVTAIHPVAEVLALAVVPPGLPEDAEWGEERPISCSLQSLLREEQEGGWPSKPEVRRTKGLARKREKRTLCHLAQNCLQEVRKEQNGP